MTLSTILSFARTQSQSDSNSLTDANGIIFANEALLDFHRKLIDKGVDASELSEAYQTVTVDANGRSSFLFPSDMFLLKTIEVDFTQTGNNYITASQIDVSNIQDQSFDWLRSNQSTDTPLFDPRGDWGEIFPAQPALIRIFYFLQPTQYSATSDTVQYPDNLDQAILGWRVAANYLYSLTRIAEGDAFNQKYEERIMQLVSTLGRGSQQPIQATPIQLTGFEF